MDKYLELLAEIDKQKRLKGLTNHDLAVASGLADSTINGFMGGKRFSKLVAEKISSVLNITSIMSDLSTGAR